MLWSLSVLVMEILNKKDVVAQSAGDWAETGLNSSPNTEVVVVGGGGGAGTPSKHS